jgi:hypothetical protein
MNCRVAGRGKRRKAMDCLVSGEQRKATSVDQRVHLPVGTIQHVSVDHSSVSIMRSGGSAARKTLGISAARPPHLRDLGGYGTAGNDDDDDDDNESGSDERNTCRKEDEVKTADYRLTKDELDEEESGSDDEWEDDSGSSDGRKAGHKKDEVKMVNYGLTKDEWDENESGSDDEWEDESGSDERKAGKDEWYEDESVGDETEGRPQKRWCENGRLLWMDRR